VRPPRAAAALGYALLAKDRIKETMHDAFGAPGPDRAWSRRLGGAAMELLWALAADAPAVVIEANFRPAVSKSARSCPAWPRGRSRCTVPARPDSLSSVTTPASLIRCMS
jgi:hypothetical protein